MSRALLVFLRKEGFDAAVVSEDPGAWAAELSGRPFSAERDRTAAPDADVVIVSPHVTGERRHALCRRVRDLTARAARVPIVTLRDAGDGDERAAASATIGATGAVGGPRRPDEAPAPPDCGDATIAWPFRLREVLGTIDSLIVGEPQAASA